MKLPSKELLSEVLHMKLELGDINRYYLIKDERHLLRLILTDKTDCWNYDINIYEFAFKCKEWAKLKHFIDIDSHPGCARWGEKAVSHNGKPSVFYEQVFIGRTEPEAIFKACEYIMEQTKCGS